MGKGGYAEVYKGTMNGGEEIAVKRLTRTSRDERKEKEFLTEIGTIGHVNHSNVLPLLGCCIDNGLYLVFELSSRGSVASLIHGNFFFLSKKNFFFSNKDLKFGSKTCHVFWVCKNKNNGF